MEKVYCKFCGKYVTEVGYLIEPDERAVQDLKDKIRENCSAGTIHSNTLGCDIVIDDKNIIFNDVALDKTMENYGMNATKKQPDGTEKRIVSKYTRFSVQVGESVPMDSYVEDFFRVTQDAKIFGKLKQDAFASIDGWYLTYGKNHNPACLLCCGSCHMRLETHRVRSIQENGGTFYESDEITDENVNIMFFGTRSSGKTVLLLAMLNELFSISGKKEAIESFEKMNDAYVSVYYEFLEQDLFFNFNLPDATGTNQPPVTVLIGKYKVTLIDTMGEVVGKNKMVDPVEILNHSDAIVIIHPICKPTEQQANNEIDITQTINQLLTSSSFIRKLIRTTQTESMKHTMLLFNKCDIFGEVAQEMMLGEPPNLGHDELRKNNRNAQQVQLLRKVFFNRNSDIVITEICKSLAVNCSEKQKAFQLKQASERLYQDCRVLSDNRVRIQCISPLGGPDPSSVLESRMYVADFVNMLIELCEEISNGKQKI